MSRSDALSQAVVGVSQRLEPHFTLSRQVRAQEEGASRRRWHDLLRLRACPSLHSNKCYIDRRIGLYAMCLHCLRFVLHCFAFRLAFLTAACRMRRNLNRMLGEGCKALNAEGRMRCRLGESDRRTFQLPPLHPSSLPHHGFIPQLSLGGAMASRAQPKLRRDGPSDELESWSRQQRDLDDTSVPSTSASAKRPSALSHKETHPIQQEGAIIPFTTSHFSSFFAPHPTQQTAVTTQDGDLRLTVRRRRVGRGRV